YDSQNFSGSIGTIITIGSMNSHTMVNQDVTRLGRYWYFVVNIEFFAKIGNSLRKAQCLCSTMGSYPSSMGTCDVSQATVFLIYVFQGDPKSKRLRRS